MSRTSLPCRIAGQELLTGLVHHLVEGAAAAYPALLLVLVQDGRVSGAQPQRRVGLPSGREPLRLGQLHMLLAARHQGQPAAALRRGQLAVVAQRPEHRPVLGRVQPRCPAGRPCWSCSTRPPSSSVPGRISTAPRCAPLLRGVAEELRRVVDLVLAAGRLAQDVSGCLARCQEDHVTLAGRGPHPGRCRSHVRLAGAGRPDDRVRPCGHWSSPGRRRSLGQRQPAGQLPGRLRGPVCEPPPAPPASRRAPGRLVPRELRCALLAGGVEQLLLTG